MKTYQLVCLLVLSFFIGVGITNLICIPSKTIKPLIGSLAFNWDESNRGDQSIVYTDGKLYIYYYHQSSNSWKEGLQIIDTLEFWKRRTQ
jgi:hypothetical protein